MQATYTTRLFGTRQIKQTAVAIGIVTSLAIGVGVAAIVRDTADTDTGRTMVVARPHTDRQDVFGYSSMEQNLQLPGSIVSAANLAMDYRYLEMNVDLPGSVTMNAPEWRTLEENSWGENFVLDGASSRSIAPNADDVVQPHTAEVVY